MRTDNISQRRLVLADVENLLATASPAEQAVVQVFQDLNTILGDLDNTLFEVACSHRAAAAVRWGFPIGRHHWRSGANGADLALIDVLSSGQVIERFQEVVIASGDGIFTAPVTALAAAGVKCTVVSRRDALSARLSLAAHKVFLLEDAALAEKAIADAA